MIQSKNVRTQTVVLLSIVVTGVIAYLPTVDNFFIADDFGLFTVIPAALKSPRWFFESTTEFFRLMSYIYFGICFKLFGLSSQPYYWAGIALHAAVSLLVYFFVLQTTKSSIGAWAAGIFFAAYERHQEAVMWISAANETILALNCLLFLLLWRRAADSKRIAFLVPAYLIFVVALFSKEAAVVLAPVAAIQLLLAGYSPRAVLRKSAVLFVLLVGFGLLWLTVAQRNFFLTRGYYALGWHFLPVYARSLVRLATQIIPFLAAWLAVRRYQSRSDTAVTTDQQKPPNSWSWNSAILFAALLGLAIVPYSFLTYLNHIPSRNTYLPSVGLAGIVGMLFALLYTQVRTERAKRAAVLFICGIVAANVSYIWLKKEPQYRERAAPTLELIHVLNAHEVQQTPVRVCGFPLDTWTFTEAVTRFTQFKTSDVILADNCDPNGTAVLRWDQTKATYVSNLDQFSELRNSATQ